MPSEGLLKAGDSREASRCPIRLPPPGRKCHLKAGRQEDLWDSMQPPEKMPCSQPVLV